MLMGHSGRWLAGAAQARERQERTDLLIAGLSLSEDSRASQTLARAPVTSLSRSHGG